MKLKISDLETPRLLAYLNIIDNLQQGSTQIINTAMDFVKKGAGTVEDYKEIFTEAGHARDEALQIAEKIQKELDLRMSRDLGINYGIRRCQVLVQKFEKKMTELETENMQKLQDEYKKAAGDADLTIK